MAIDPSISLKIQTPRFADPIEQYAKVAQVRNLLTQGQLHQQQIANEQEQLRGAQMKNQETERAQQDNDLYQQQWRAAGGDLKKAREGAIAAGVRSGYITKLDDEINKQAEQLAKTDKEKITAASAKLDFLYENLSPIAAVTDPVQQGALWDAKMKQAVQAGALAQNEVTPYAGPSAVQDELAHVTSQKHLIGLAEAKRKEALAPSQLAKSEADATIAWQKATGTEPMQPKDVATLGREKLRDAQIKINESEGRRLEGIRVGLESQRNAREQKIYEETYGEGSNEALRGVEPKLRVPAARDAQKAADTYNKAVTAAEDMQTFLDLARKGNKAAGSNLPLVGVSTINALNGIKRINQAEIQQYEGAGSLLDRIQGRIGKLVVGQPIPKDVLDDIETLHKTLAGKATEAYTRTLDSINQNYHSSYKPVGQKTGAAAPQMIRARDKAGNLHEAAVGTALPDGWTLEGK